MTDDPVLAAVQRFMDAVELRLTKQTDDTRSALAEMRSVFSDMQTRAAQSGPAGADGAPGRDGVDGKDGRDGKDGEPGPAGEKGERGADGLNGRDGAPSMIPGPQGPQGERGADGIATRAELEMLIEERFAELQVRTFADVYQGVYEVNKSYTRGVLATWGGSLWLSQAATKAKPGESEDWKLVVKRGADGRR